MSETTFHTYILASAFHGTLYTGHTDNLFARVEAHRNKTHSGFTAKYGCRHLVWSEAHTSRQAAFTREQRIKEWKRAWKIELIEADNPYWIDIHACTYWPLPSDAEIIARPDLTAFRDECFAAALDPDFRRDERFLMATGYMLETTP